MEKTEYTIGFLQRPRARESTPYDHFRGQEVKVDVSGLSGEAGRLADVYYDHGNLVLELSPHVYFGPGQAKMVDSMQPVIIGPGSSSTISPQNLEELVKEINKAKAKKRRNQ